MKKNDFSSKILATFRKTSYLCTSFQWKLACTTVRCIAGRIILPVVFIEYSIFKEKAFPPFSYTQTSAMAILILSLSVLPNIHSNFSRKSNNSQFNWLLFGWWKVMKCWAKSNEWGHARSNELQRSQRKYTKNIGRISRYNVIRHKLILFILFSKVYETI